MVLGAETVLMAGPPNFVNERQIYRLPDTPETQAQLQRQLEAAEGKHGGVLWAVGKDGGDVLARYALDTVPVFDGMAAARGRVYLSTLDGHLVCLDPGADAKLPEVEGLPERILWDHEEDPNYLLPAKAAKKKST
jgi:hypothetical protein